jgi:hypothetical protein
MAAVEAILAVLGVLFLALIVMVAVSDRDEPPAPVEDLAAPYREGLHAAVRMQRVAQDLEQQIYAEAARHLSEPGEGGPTA